MTTTCLNFTKKCGGCPLLAMPYREQLAQKQARLQELLGGFAPVKGKYVFKVVPANAAKLDGEKTLKVSLKPGERLAWDARVAPTGKAPNFRVEAIGDSDALPTTYISLFLAPEAAKA